MPTYEFQCELCDATFEAVVSSALRDAARDCPQCGRPQVKRTLSAFYARSAGTGGPSVRLGGGG